MTKAIAKLVKKKTDDGLIETYEHIPLGKIYTIDLDTIREEKMFNIKKKKYHSKLIVTCVDEADFGFWIPMECLEVLKAN